MAYIDYEYFKTEFAGCDIPNPEFLRLVSIASDVIDSIVSIDIDENADYMNSVKKATAYEVEMIYAQGGADAITGMASCNAVSSESLGSYSISMSNNSNNSVKSKGGIPISELSISLLKKAGLMSRWAYFGRHR